MEKDAFRSVVGKLRHAKRVIQTTPASVKGGLIGAGAGGLIGGLTEKSLQDYKMKANPKKKKLSKKKRVSRIVGAGLVGAFNLGSAGATIGSSMDSIRDGKKLWRQLNSKKRRRASQGGGGGGSSKREAGPAKTKDVGTPDWLKGVTSKADAKTKFREQAKIHHPDRGGSEERMKKVNSDWDSFQKHHFHKLSFALAPFLAELKEIYREHDR